MSWAWWGGDAEAQQQASIDAVLAGTASVTFGQSGTFRSSAALTGAAPVTVGQTGNFRAAASLAGSGAVIINQSGALNAGTGLAGTAPIVIGLSGTMASNAALSGASTITFDGVASLDVGAATPEPVIIIDGGASSTRKPERNWEAELRQIIDKAFDAVFAEPPVPPAVVRKRVAKLVRSEIRTEGLAISAARIDAMVAEYLRLLRQQEDDDEEEAVAALLLAA